MADVKTATLPPTQAQTLQKPSAPDTNQSKKRRFDDAHLQNSTIFKIRSIIRDLRPSAIQVIISPDIKTCEAANEIRKQIQNLMELSKQLRSELNSSDNRDKLEGHPSATDALEKRGDERADRSQPEKVSNKAGDAKLAGQKISELKSESVLRGSYVIGGSPVGWNFMMYPGTGSVYYGETKASFVSRRLKSPVIRSS